MDYTKALELKQQGVELKEIMKILNIDMQYKAFQRGLLRYEESLEEAKEGEEEYKPKYEELEKGYKIYYGKQQRNNVFIAYEDLEEAFNLYCIAHLTLNEVALKMNLTRREFYAIKTAFDITKDSMPFTPKQIDYYTAEEIAEKYRIKKKQYALTKIEQNKNKDIENRIKQMDTVDFWYKELCQSVNQIKPEPYKIISKKLDTDEINTVYIADVHSGLEVDNYFNTYNLDIMDKRFKRLAQGIIENVNSRILYIADLGDTVHE